MCRRNAGGEKGEVGGQGGFEKETIGIARSHRDGHMGGVEEARMKGRKNGILHNPIPRAWEKGTTVSQSDKRGKWKQRDEGEARPLA